MVEYSLSKLGLEFKPVLEAIVSVGHKLKTSKRSWIRLTIAQLYIFARKYSWKRFFFIINFKYLSMAPNLLYG